MSETFDQHAAIYDLLIDWDRRLANEEPFYRQLVERLGARRVLDAACGTGRHAAMFHSWGLEVQGADVSAGMLAACRSRYGEPTGLRWVLRSFDQPVEPAGYFDLVVCVGNSLALAGDTATIERSLANLLDAVRPGGVCLVQVLNLWSLTEAKTIWQKCRKVSHEGQDHVLLKSLRRIGDRGQIDFVDLECGDAEVRPRYDAVEFLGIRADRLAEMARNAGAREVELFGSFKRDAYQRETSSDLIALCRK